MNISMSLKVAIDDLYKNNGEFNLYTLGFHLTVLRDSNIVPNVVNVLELALDEIERTIQEENSKKGRGESNARD